MPGSRGLWNKTDPFGTKRIAPSIRLNSPCLGVIAPFTKHPFLGKAKALHVDINVIMTTYISDKKSYLNSLKPFEQCCQVVRCWSTPLKHCFQGAPAQLFGDFLRSSFGPLGSFSAFTLQVVPAFWNLSPLHPRNLASLFCVVTWEMSGLQNQLTVSTPCWNGKT